MGYEEIVYEIGEGVATITLNRPDKLNAITAKMQEELRQAMHAAGADEAVRVIVLTGAGRGFCAGADMNLLSDLGDAESGARDRDRAGGGGPAGNGAVAGGEGEDGLPNDFRLKNTYFPSIPKPVIAAINGACAGLGLVWTLYCDLRFAADTAKFTTAFSRRGLIAEHGISWMLPRLVGMANAMDILLSARKFDAAEAERIGLINRAIPYENFESEVRAYAEELAKEVSPRSLRIMKRQLYAAQFQTLGEAVAIADREMELSFDSADFKEGVAHFVERRKPAFTGN